MKRYLIVLIIAAGALASAGSAKAPVKNYATCKGESPCKACKNCKYCKRCAKEGLTCGVCKK
jgi:hypothetical protein